MAPRCWRHKKAAYDSRWGRRGGVQPAMSTVGRSGARLLLRQLTERLNDLTVLRKSICLVFRENQNAVGGDIEDPILVPDQFRLRSKVRKNRGRQTGSLGQVVSLSTVSNGDMHRRSPIRGPATGKGRLASSRKAWASQA
jgi:hypothetical protein